ncbi:hypothetical protein F2P81_004873 [Scophthalmus maximus]|uniref:Uncharacterized protein n=1 Tax=Scophthalmus maximus TaxID=52904 RepID=A0A6A4T7L4_SCOMX|nr:hypothetical protein F2P81_004873 [Scophthalmus maximus]
MCVRLLQEPLEEAPEMPCREHRNCDCPVALTTFRICECNKGTIDSRNESLSEWFIGAALNARRREPARTAIALIYSNLLIRRACPIHTKEDESGNSIRGENSLFKAPEGSDGGGHVHILIKQRSGKHIINAELYLYGTFHARSKAQNAQQWRNGPCASSIFIVFIFSSTSSSETPASAADRHKQKEQADRRQRTGPGNIGTLLPKTNYRSCAGGALACYDGYFQYE